MRAKWSVLELIRDSVGSNVSNEETLLDKAGRNAPHQATEKAVHKAGGKVRLIRLTAK